MPFITLKLFASLNKFTPPEWKKYPISQDTTVLDLIAQLSIPKDQARLVFVNGVKMPPSVKLKGNDRVGIFPPIGGG